MLKRFKDFKIEVSHTKYLIFFTLFMYIVYNIINLDKLTMWFYANDQFALFGFIAYSILGYGLFLAVFTIIAHKFTTKFISIFLIISSTFITYFILKYNIAMDTSMLLNVINTDATESLPLFSTQMIPYVIFLLILPVIFVLKVKIVYEKPLKNLLKSIALVIISLLVAVGSVYASFKEIHRAGNLSNKYILYSLVPVNILAASIDVVKKKVVRPLLGKEKSEDIMVDAKVTKKEDLVVVLAIGEAIRQQNLNIYGYDRVSTTPQLSKYDDLHILNGHARLGSTLYALREILRKDGIKLTNVAFSADVNTSIYSHYTLYNKSNVVPEIKVKPHKYEKAYDEDVIPYLEKNLESYKDGQRLILLHLGGGVHGPIYSYRYPESFVKYTPTCEDPDMLNQCTQEERFNSYDNGMLYQDYVTDQLIKKLDKSKVPYVLIYVSDHGESLGEGGYVFHGMPPGMSLPPEQAKVPLFVKSSVPIQIVKKDRYDQPFIFDTVLDLLNIETKEFDKKDSFIKRVY